MSSTTAKQTYKGNCHCGSVKFSVDLEPIKEVAECNCSICYKQGYLYAFPASLPDFRIDKGSEILQDYTFGPDGISHKFCPKCGTPLFVTGSPRGSPAINIRTFKHGLVDVKTLKIRILDNKNLGSPYQIWKPEAKEIPTVPEGKKLYTGSCHCQKVKYTVVWDDITKVTICTCSLCSRDADMWIYPPTSSSVNFHGTEKNMTIYRYGSAFAFCGTCGVSVANLVDAPGVQITPINTRTMEGLDVEKLEVEEHDGWAMGKMYDV